MYSDSPDPSVRSSLPQHWLFDSGALQEYLLICCQVTTTTSTITSNVHLHQDHRGGLLDKPGKSRDFYHTCYTLSGLSLAQTFASNSSRCTITTTTFSTTIIVTCTCTCAPSSTTTILGPPSNLLAPTHPVYNICLAAVAAATTYFEALPTPLVLSA